jgi:hypothetical protein
MFPDQQIEHQKTAPAEKGPYENQTGFIIYEVTMAKPAVSRTGKPKKFIQLNWHSYGV